MDQVSDIKVRRHAVRGQFKANRIIIIIIYFFCESSEEGQPGTKLRIYSFVFVKIYPYIPLLFLSHSFSPLVGFQDNWTPSSSFFFLFPIQVTERSNMEPANQTVDLRNEKVVLK